MTDTKQSGKLFTNLKQHALTAISYLIPIVVSGGFLLAIGSLLGGATINDIKESYNFFDVMYTMGGLVLGMLPVVIATGISFSISDKPGIAPGFLVGLISINMNAGFIGGFIGGYIAGYLTRFLKEKIKVPLWAEGLKPMLIIPFISSVVVGFIMYFVLGFPISALTDTLNNFLLGLDTSQKLMFGLIVGVLSAIDYGGPINKVVFAFLLSLQSEGINEPMAVLMLASMVTPFGMSIAFFLQKIFKKNIYNRMEVETLKTAFPMGVCMITEGCYPIIFNDLWRCIDRVYRYRCRYRGCIEHDLGCSFSSSSRWFVCHGNDDKSSWVVCGINDRLNSRCCFIISVEEASRLRRCERESSRR